MSRYPEPAGFDALASREIEVLRLYPELGLNKLIAHRLGISEQTVKNYNSSILRKLGVLHIGQAALLFDRWASGRRSWPDVNRRKAERRQADRRQVVS